MLYFLNLHTCGSVFEDPEGVELIDLEAARTRAILAARDVMSHEVAEGRLCLSCHIEVCDRAGRNLMTVKFREALELSGLN